MAMPGVDRAAGRVDVEADVALGVLGGEQQHLGADPVGDVVVHLLAEEDDPVPEQALEERVAQGHHRRLRGARDDARCLEHGELPPIACWSASRRCAASVTVLSSLEFTVPSGAA